jgi:ferritin-like metal-binding protein YciE
MQLTHFDDLYLSELQELRNMKTQLTDAHQRLAEAALNPKLIDAFMHHHDETEQQIERLDDLLQRHGADPEAHTDQAMEALIHESRKMISIVPESELRDVALIASAQKIAHYEIAAFGSAAALAGQLDLRDDQKLLHACLQEEKRADVALSKLAKAEINPDAAAAE